MYLGGGAGDPVLSNTQGPGLMEIVIEWNRKRKYQQFAQCKILVQISVCI